MSEGLTIRKVKATCAIIVNDRKQILLIKRGRDPFAGYWALISGIGETKKGLLPTEAVKGEVMCDLQTTFLESRVLFSMPVLNDNYVDEIVVFEGIVNESSIKVNPPFSLQYSWFSSDEIKKIDRLAYEHAQILTNYFKLKK